MAGAIVASATDAGSLITKYSVVWVSDATGAVSGSTFTMRPGTLVRVDFIPGAGALAPADLYDLDVLDVNDVSIFDDGAGTSVGVNLSATLAHTALPLIGLANIGGKRRWLPGGNFELDVAAAGDSNAGTVEIYVMAGVV